MVAMGPSPHDFLAVDWHLGDVLAWFGTRVMQTVYLVSEDYESRGDTGVLQAGGHAAAMNPSCAGGPDER